MCYCLITYNSNDDYWEYLSDSLSELHALIETSHKKYYKIIRTLTVKGLMKKIKRFERKLKIKYDK